MWGLIESSSQCIVQLGMRKYQKPIDLKDFGVLPKDQVDSPCVSALAFTGGLRGRVILNASGTAAGREARKHTTKLRGVSYVNKLEETPKTPRMPG